MHPGTHATTAPDKTAYVMAASGETVTYAALDAYSNQCAHFFRAAGLKTGDGIAILLENHPKLLALCWGAHRAGLYYTLASWHLQPQEVAYIVDDCQARIFITSKQQESTAGKAAQSFAAPVSCFMLDGISPEFSSFDDAVAAMPKTPIADETEGADMLYSSGTTGRPKGIRIPLLGVPLGTPTPLTELAQKLYGISAEATYLSPAPLYHAAPLRFCMSVLRHGGTVVVMERFDAEQALAYIQSYRCTHSQWVPTMFVRMLKLPETVRASYDVSSMQIAIHAAAPCPREVKHQMIAWWGPVLHEYYAGTEGNGMTIIDSEEWLHRPGSVGKAIIGTIHIVDDDGREQPPGQAGTVYFSGGREFSYHNDPSKTAEAYNNKGWSTLGDIGYLDGEGYLFLTDRKAHMIISGGVNIYPQEVENLLVTHSDVMDAAVIGVPNTEFGEEVKAVVQPVAGVHPTEALAEDLIVFCRDQLSAVKCPRSVDFVTQLPREANGKLYKRKLRDQYWPADRRL